MDKGCADRPLSAPDPGGPLALPVLFGPALGDPGWSMVLCPLGGLVEGLASLLWM